MFPAPRHCPWTNGGQWLDTVNRIVRPRMACSGCDCFTQAPLPSCPIKRGKPGPGLLAHVPVNKYADHLPPYRQSQICERDGLDLDRSTLADWVGKSTALLEPLADAIGRHVLAGQAIFVDDTPVAMLALPCCEGGTGKTQTARLWTYARDERPWGSAIPPASLAMVLGPVADHGSISVLLRPQRLPATLERLSSTTMTTCLQIVKALAIFV